MGQRKSVRLLISYILSLFVILTGAWSLTGCAHGREYRLYVYDANRQLFVRDIKTKDVLTHEQADGLICQKPEDMKKSIIGIENIGQ